jgi:DNA-directed RNA polymerase subunit M/transcription elongation factor TFIIS
MDVMSQQELLELAKQGDAKAISTLMNRQLQPKGILAKSAVKEGCLQVILEAKSAPPQQEVTAYIWNAMNKLGAASIQKVKIYGKQSGDDFPVWQQEFELNSPLLINNLPSINNVKASVLTTQNQASDIVKDVILLECRGDATILTVKSEGVMIQRLGGLLSVHKKGERFIPYKNIINLQLHKPGTFSYGFIYFQIVGSQASGIKYMEAASDVDAVIFQNDKLSEFDKARFLVLENLNLPSHSSIAQEQGQSGSVMTNSEVQIKCPKCGSTQINANKKGFNIGQALVGGVVTLGVGVAAGFWGSNEVRLNCLRCGHRWKPNV